MRIAGIEYEIKPSLAINAPKGRLPYIDDHGTTIVDSHFIVTYLKTTYKELDKHLSSSKNVVSRAMQHLLEEHLLWIGLYSRWQYSDEN